MAKRKTIIGQGGDHSASDARPDTLDLLLPWYDSGTLSVDELSRLDVALTRDASLRRQLATIRKEQSEIISLHEDAGAPSPRALLQLFAGIDRGVARQSGQGVLPLWPARTIARPVAPVAPVRAGCLVKKTCGG